ncbi:TetR family transcriptional regulator [Nocardioides albertanoniae]|uniref:TetR family transcriptional regulator n=1 Tax=Nocardioides albertanoniae TaxID=1175486 RepID=A0A543A226_9ACTN|nr:TetR family transcriptional regulator [Nocardioides albertanoniae]TQL66624.1 TetR family transcriptional regulator [Nocardioides albertanoniae]
MSTEAPRRGRRPGSPDTRAAILTAARQSFAQQGYAATSVRGIAAAAGVDSSLVHHYFGTKQDLFVASLELRVDPRVIAPTIIVEGKEHAGERLVRLLLSVWDDEEARLPLMALVRSVFEPEGMSLAPEAFGELVLGPVGEALELDEPERRMGLVGSQLVGIIVLRYVARLEPLASAPPETLVATYAPVIQGYLTGPLP